MIIEVHIEAVIAVTAEQLIRTFANLHYLCPGIARQLRDIVKRNTDRVGDRLVLVKDHVGEKIDKVLLADHYFMMIGAVLASDVARFFDLVVSGVVAKPNRERANGPI